MDLGLFCNQYAIQLGITLLSLRLAVRQSRNLTFAHIGTYTVFSAEANIRRTRGTSQDKITTKVSHSHKAHGGYEEPQAVSKMPVYHFRSQESAFRREKFVRSDFFPLKRKNRLSRSSGQIGRICRGASGIFEKCHILIIKRQCSIDKLEKIRSRSKRSDALFHLSE